MKLNKKAAMFGLEGRALRKQSSGLFLASLRKLTSKRLVAGQQATRVITQRGAMFGLDARIALVVMTTISLITGASLYTVYAEVEVTNLITEMKDIGKAYEQYTLDTRKPLPLVTPIYYKIRDLVTDPGHRGWNGPYIDYTATADAQVDHPEYSFLAIMNRPVIYEWGGKAGVDSSLPSTCPSGCRPFVIITGIPTEYAPEIDLAVDGVVDARKGRVRTWDQTNGKSNIYYQLAIDPYNLKK